jgi:isocitrate dehydrogenase
MLDHLGWTEAARAIESALEKTIGAKTVTYDFARLMDGAKEVGCFAFGKLVAEAVEEKK